MKTFNMENLPDKVRCIKRVDLYKPGTILRLYYRGDKDAIYKVDGTMYGLSPANIIIELNNNNAEPIKP